jgi:hypothetical protein
MSLLLTHHVNQNRIDLRPRVRSGLRPDGLGTARLEPFADQVAVKTITLDDQHASHGWLRS